MSRIDNVVFVSTLFNKGKDDIQQALDAYDVIYLQAQSQAIETAILLAEHFVRNQKTVKYDQFTSNLIENQEHQLIPKCSITLKYSPQTKKEKSKENQKYVEKDKNVRKESEEDDKKMENKEKVKMYKEKRESQQAKKQRKYEQKNKK